MKTLMFLILIILSGELMAQTDTTKVSYQRQIDHIQYNLDKYHSEKMTSYAAGALSAVCFVASALTVDEQTSVTLLCIGAASSLVGTVIRIDSEKWIKKASVRIVPGKLTINF